MRHPISISVGCVAVCAMLSLPLSADVPRELAEELSPVVDEGLASDEGEARAWALRARTLTGGRDLRQLLLDHRDNTDLMVRVFASLGLVEMGRDEGLDGLAEELKLAGSASRRRILERYVQHLSEDDQEAIVGAALAAVEDDGALRELLVYVARHGQGEVFGLFGRAAAVGSAQREIYLDELIRSGRPEAVDVAEQLAGSSDPEARRAAARVAADVTGDEARRLLETLLGDGDADVASAAAFALAPLGVAAAYEQLLSIAASGETAERGRALEAIRDGQPELLAFEDVFAMLEGVTDEELKLRIYEALGATGSDEAYNLLLGMLGGDVYEDRVLAIAGLGYTGREAAVPLLGDVLLGGGGENLRKLAAESLGHLQVRAAAEPLLAALDRERGGEVKLAVIDALATTGSEDALWPLAFQLTSTDDDVVEAVLETLARLGAAQVAPQIETVATSHRDPGVRWTATLVLFSLDPEVGQIRLRQALDRPPEGFMADIDALPSGPRLEAYTRLVRHSNPDIRAQALGRVLRQPDGGLAILRELTGSTAPSDIREAAIGVLTANRDPADLALFTEVAESSSRVLRMQALEALVELAPQDSEELFRGLLDATDLTRRVMAVYGLWNQAGR